MAADPAATVWAISCGTAQQEAVFRRTVELLGPPAGRRGHLVDRERGDHAVLVRAEVALAERERAPCVQQDQAVRRVQLPYPRSLFKSFKIGSNIFEVRATRAALPAGKKQCNVHGQKPYVALAAKFHLDFATDLRVGIPEEK